MWGRKALHASIASTNVYIHKVSPNPKLVYGLKCKCWLKGGCGSRSASAQVPQGCVDAVGWLADWLAGWLAVWLSGSLAACMVGWLNVAGGEGDAAGEGEGWKGMMGDGDGDALPAFIALQEQLFWGSQVRASRGRGRLALHPSEPRRTCI